MHPKEVIMNYKFVTNITTMEHDAFVSKHPLCNLLQSSNWASVKDNWKSTIVGVKEKDHLVASAMILIKQLPFTLCMFYIPRGPILDYENQPLLSYFLTALKAYAKKQHCIYITVDPGLHCNDYTLKDINENRYPITNEVIHCFRGHGAIFKGFTKSIDDTIQPRYHANVYACDDFETTLPKSTRKNLTIAQKKMLEVKLYGEDAVSDFARIMQLTEERKHIQLRGEGYFRKIMQAYGEEARIVLVKLPLKKLYEETQKRFDQNEDDLTACPENAKKKRFTLEELQTSLHREVSDLKMLFEEHGDEIYVAGALVVKYGETAEILYAGMNDTFKRYMAPYTSFYNCITWSFSKGCTSCNMGGIEGDFNDGLTKFKANFNPMINEFIGEFDLPVRNIMYRGAMQLLRMRKR